MSVTLSANTFANKIVVSCSSQLIFILDLPNGCRCSNLTVIPKKWETGGSSLLKKNWAIVYRFYKPSGEYKQIWIRGMNRFKTLPERRRETNISLEKEYQFLKEGLDPLQEQKPAVSADETGSNKSEINSKSLFLEALDYAFVRACKRVKNKTKISLSFEYTYIKRLIKTGLRNEDKISLPTD